MPKVVIESRENVAIVRLNNGVINAINTELVDDLSRQFIRLKPNLREWYWRAEQNSFVSGWICRYCSNWIEPG
jgi:enoyl-CoA hydratase/carnithine racemase